MASLNHSWMSGDGSYQNLSMEGLQDNQLKAWIGQEKCSFPFLVSKLHH